MMNSLSNTTMRKLRVIALPLVLSGFLTACLGGGGGDTTTSAATDTSTNTPTTPSTSTPTPTPEPTQVQGSATLLWNQPTTNTDGSTLADLQGYKVYQGTASNDLRQVATVAFNQLNYKATGLTQGRTYYFAVSAYNRNNVESSLSNVASKTIN